VSTVEKHDAHCYIHPERPLRLAWDMCILSLALLSMCTAPFEVSFMWDSHNQSVALLWINSFSDIFFGVDMILNCFTAFHQGKGLAVRLVTRRRDLIINYLRGWFWIDLLATFPFWSLTSTKALGLLRVLRMRRVFKPGGLIRGIEERVVVVQSMTVALQLMKLSVIMFIFSHLVACAWFAVGFFGENAYETTWLHAQGLLGRPIWEQWVASFHLAITMGFGNSYATNTSEQIFGSALLIVAVIYIGSFIARVAQVVSSLRVAEAMLNQAKREAILFCTQRKVPQELRFQVLRYIEHTHKTDSITSMDPRFLGTLSESLRQRLRLAVMGKILTSFPLFAEADEAFIAALCEVACTRRAGPGDIVAVEEQAAHEMFWVVLGEVAVLRDGQHLNTLVANDWFGELSLLCPGTVRTATVRCETQCEFLVLDHEHFHQQMREFPRVRREYEKLLHNLKAGSQQGFKLTCRSCGSGDHLTKDCPN